MLRRPVELAGAKLTFGQSAQNDANGPAVRSKKIAGQKLGKASAGDRRRAASRWNAVNIAKRAKLLQQVGS